MNKLFLNCIAAGALLASNVMAGEKTVMHCVIFAGGRVPVEDLDAFAQATDDLARKIQGIRHIWRGPMMPPLVIDRKFTDGICMEMNGKTLLTLEKEPAYKAWNEAYTKVRIVGSAVTFDLLGQ